MRILLASILLVAACSVPDKTPPPDFDPNSVDGGVDMPDAPPGPTDTTAPDTTITSQPAEFSNNGTAMFEFTATESDVTFTCSVDGAMPVACTSPFSKTLTDGGHSFSVRATDSAGNSDDTPAEARWTIDRAAPSTTITKKPASADNSTAVKFEFTSGEQNVTFECQLDGSAYAACTSPKDVSVNDGSHSFAVRAKDRAGNIDASPATWAWTVDTSTPDTQILTGPPAVSETTSATFTFSSADAGSGATFQCSLDGGSFGTCVSPRTYNSVSAGNHTFQVKVRDAVGNMDPTPAVYSWSVDLTAPNTTIDSGPTGVQASASATFTFSASEQGATFECQLDGGNWNGCTSPANLANLGQGSHTFGVRASDAAGHADATPATRTWTVDTAAPDIDITQGPANNGSSGPRVGFTFTVSEGAPQCSLDNAAFAACTSPVVWNLPAGTHTFSIRATDGAGNQALVTRSWTVNCSAPASNGAAAQLHLDDNGQVQTNSVGGGAAATLGDTDQVEPTDPAFVAAARFGGGFAFTPSEMDHLAWPTALGTSNGLTVELWAKPDSVANARDLLVSADGRVLVRVVSASTTTVRFTATVLEDAGGAARTVQSAPVAANDWHHVLVTLDEPNLVLYVDGVKTQNTAVNLVTPIALDALTIGGNYQGALDEIWVAQTPITSDEAALGRYCPL